AVLRFQSQDQRCFKVVVTDSRVRVDTITITPNIDFFDSVVRRIWWRHLELPEQVRPSRGRRERHVAIARRRVPVELRRVPCARYPLRQGKAQQLRDLALGESAPVLRPSGSETVRARTTSQEQRPATKQIEFPVWQAHEDLNELPSRSTCGDEEPQNCSRTS